MLHSWAFQKFLLQYSEIDTEILDYTTPHLYGRNLKYPMWALLKNGNIKGFIIACIRVISHKNRFEKFEQFKKNNLIISEKRYSQEKLATAKINYDVIVCESDVIWCPNFFGGDFDPTFFGALPSMRNVRCVSYAASMGNGGFNDKQERHFIRLLNNLDSISCRETYASVYTQKFYDKKVECVVDPVLLLSADEYDSITSTRIIKEPYLLLYFPLGYDKHIVSTAKEYATKRELKFVELSRYPWDRVRNKTITDAGIEEFLSLIRYADVVFSNSFHAVCFSVIFKRDFYAFNRATGRKIEDICDRLKLHNRFIDGAFYEQQPIDYDVVHRILNGMVKSSVEFIENNLGLQNEQRKDTGKI